MSSRINKILEKIDANFDVTGNFKLSTEDKKQLKKTLKELEKVKKTQEELDNSLARIISDLSNYNYNIEDKFIKTNFRELFESIKGNTHFIVKGDLKKHIDQNIKSTETVLSGKSILSKDVRYGGLNY